MNYYVADWYHTNDAVNREIILDQNLNGILNLIPKEIKPPLVSKKSDNIGLEYFCNACLIHIALNETTSYTWTITSYIHGTTYSGTTEYTVLEDSLKKSLYQYFRK